MIFLILLLGLALRLVNLNQSLWLDEAITALAVKNNSLTQIITVFSPGDFHPPLYYLFLKIWTDFFGYSEIALRLPSIISSLISIYFVYLIGKKNGLVAALFLAVNPLAIYYSQEARMYSLAMVLVTGSIYFLLEKRYFWFIVCAAASIYTDYLPALMFPVYFLMTKNRRIALLPVLLFLPWLPYFLIQLQYGIGASASTWGDLLGRTSVKNVALVPIKFVFGRISVPNNFLYLLGIGYGLVLLKNKEIKYWLWLLVPLAVAAVISLTIPVFTYFRFLFVLPAFVLLLSRGGKLATVFVVVVSLLSLAYFNLSPRFWREDWRAAADYIKEEPGKIVMPNIAQAAPLEYYEVDLESKSNTVYLFRYVQEIFDPQDLRRQELEINGYKRVEEKSFNNLLVWKYSR